MSSPIAAATSPPTRCRRKCASSTPCRNPTSARSCARICATYREANIMTLAGYSMATAAQFVGRELGVSDWVVVDQDRIGAFAECTGDRQWIHVDVERAKRESPFGGPVAHGYLTLSLVAAMVTELGAIPPDAATGLNYGLNKVRFIAPVRAGTRVRMRASLASAEPQSGGRMLLTLRSTLEIEGEAKPALVAELLCMLIGKSDASS